MKQTVYKVLVRASKKLYSLNRCLGPNSFAQRYWTNRINRPRYRGTFIMAFSNASDAKEFANCWDDTVVYKAKATVNQSNRPVQSLVSLGSGLAVLKVNAATIQNFWLKGIWPQGAGSRPIPCATVFCEDLELVGPVK